MSDLSKNKYLPRQAARVFVIQFKQTGEAADSVRAI